MAVVEKDGLLSYIDAAGNTYILYPVTKLDNVDGAEDLLKTVAQELTEAQKTQARGNIGAAAQIKNVTVSLPAEWSGSNPYTQSVSISGTTAKSKVDLQPDSEVLSQLISDGASALYIQNDSGTLTAYAIGAKPTAALTIQATVTEVME